MIEINTIYKTIMGEISDWPQGIPVTIIRFQGCSKNCKWCDTKEAQKKGDGILMSISEIMESVAMFGSRQILITGGEPLEQRKEFMKLHSHLTKLYDIAVETNGYHDIPRLFNTTWIMDWKPDISNKSKEYSKQINRAIWNADYVKFLIYDRADFDNAKLVKKEIEQESGVSVLFSAIVHKGMNNKLLCKWMLEDNSLDDCYLNVQIHKLIGLKEK